MVSGQVSSDIGFLALVWSLTPIVMKHGHSLVGMATGRVRAGFFHTRTRPAGQDPWHGHGLFRVPGYFLGPGPAPVGPHGPCLGIGLIFGPTKKKKKLSPDLFLPFKSWTQWLTDWGSVWVREGRTEGGRHEGVSVLSECGSKGLSWGRGRVGPFFEAWGVRD